MSIIPYLVEPESLQCNQYNRLSCEIFSVIKSHTLPFIKERAYIRVIYRFVTFCISISGSLNSVGGRPSNHVTQKGGGGLANCYYCIFLLFKSITILTEIVTWGRGSKIANFGVT